MPNDSPFRLRRLCEEGEGSTRLQHVSREVGGTPVNKLSRLKRGQHRKDREIRPSYERNQDSRVHELSQPKESAPSEVVKA